MGSCKIEGVDKEGVHIDERSCRRLDFFGYYRCIAHMADTLGYKKSLFEKMG